ncbi:MAG TPA: serine/threonine-protein kinase [Burkholderiaceae bacterium]|nr:serine/threonine-protein kinase [Burkholderiaceae bacterium]
MAAIDKARWQVLSPLLDELLEMDAAERPRRLALIRRDDPALGEELAVLLVQQAAVETAEFLEGSALRLPRGASLSEHVVGSYTLERPLGHGGMGTVWLARRSDGRYEGAAAVKFLHLGLLGRGGLARFRREGNLLARLAHPNIAHLIDAGVAAGQPYLVLEYVEGETIDRWCNAQRLDVDGRIRLFLDVLAAVAHAHGRLILHRDLKPSNILVTPDGRPKLLDFGVAKLVQDQPQPDEVTQLAGCAFTPDYAAPEQVQGGEATMATDVYALGVLLYVLLVGRHPTSGADATPVERLQTLVEAEPQSPSECAAGIDAATAGVRATTARQLARKLRGDLDNIIARALRKPPGERYPTAAAFADDLRRYLDHQPVRARADTLAYRLRKFVRRNRFAVGAASAVLVALAAGVIGTAWHALEARKQRDLALQEIRYARATHDVLMALLDEAFRTGAEDRWREMLERARAQLHTRHENDPTSQARILLMLAGRYAAINDERGEREVTDELIRLAPSLPDPGLRAQIACAQADIFLYGRDVARARPLVEGAMRELGTVPEPPLGPMGDCYRTDAMLAVEQGDFDRAVARGRALVARLEAEGLAGSRQHLDALTTLQRIYLDTDRDGDVLAMHGQLEEALRAQGALDTTNHILILDRRAIALVRRGQFAQAQQLMHEVLAHESPASALPAVFRAGIGRRLIVTGATREGIALTQAQLAQLERDSQRNQVYFARFALAEGALMDGDITGAGGQLAVLARSMDEGNAALRERAELARLQALHALARDDLLAAQVGVATMRTQAASLPRRARSEAMRSELTAGQVAIARGDRVEAAQALDRAATAEREAAGTAPVPADSAWRGRILLLRALLERDAGAADAARDHARLALEQFASTLPAGHPWRQQALALADGAAGID